MTHHTQCVCLRNTEGHRIYCIRRSWADAYAHARERAEQWGVRQAVHRSRFQLLPGSSWTVQTVRPLAFFVPSPSVRTSTQAHGLLVPIVSPVPAGDTIAHRALTVLAKEDMYALYHWMRGRSS